jgi:quinoprotein glucose dehydrogenase
VTDNRGHDDKWVLADLAAQTVQDRIDFHKRLLPDGGKSFTEADDQIRRLRDTDGDGNADESVVFANGFNRLEEGTGAGVLARGNEVFYTCIPKLWKLVDDTGDGVSDRRVALSDGYGVRVAFRGHDLHGLVMGPDGRVYFSIGDRGHNVTTADGRVLANPVSGSVFRCELDGSGLEVFATGLRNPQELAFNDFGDLFTGDNNSDSGDKARLVMVVKGGDTGWRMHYQYLSDRGPFNRERIWYPYEPNQPAYIVPPIANFGDGPSGFAFDPGTGGDASLRGKFLMCDFRGSPAASGIRSFKLESIGAFYKLAEDDQPIWSVLATDVAFGPDGAIWISDWVEGWNGEGKGRIYRVTGTDFDADQAAEVASVLQTQWPMAEGERLAGWLSHVDRRVRNEAQWELARRGDVTRLISVAGDTAISQLARLHAIWGIDQSLRLKTAQGADGEAAAAKLVSLLDDSDEIIRAAAAGSVGERGIVAGIDRLVQLMSDDSSRVRFHAAIALSSMKLGAKADAVRSAAVAMLAENDDADPILRHGAVMAMVGAADAGKLAALKAHPSTSVRRAVVVALRRLKAAEVVDFLADPDPKVVVEAARAIHDEPLLVGFESLARMIQTPTDDDALMRRVLNANYRLGTSETATALADFVARPVASVSLRSEAVEMLRAWGQPNPRDRVHNDYRPLAERPAAVAKAALAKALPLILKNADEVRELAITVAAEYDIAEILPVLVQRVADRNLRPEARAATLRSLVKMAPERAGEAAAELMQSSQSKLRIAAMETLSQLAPAISVDLLAKATSSENVAERQAAWDLLAKIDTPRAGELITAGVNAYLSGEIPDDTSLNVIEASAGRLNAELVQRLAEHQASLEHDSPLGKWLLSLDGGDAAAGAVVFARTQLSCVRCHRVGDTGGEVGPDLSGIGKSRDRRYLLEAICLPDAQIAKGFETVVVADDLGQVFTGIVKREDEEIVELIQPDGKLVEIELDAITARKRGKSAMPEELVTYMNARELRDLVAYLASLQAEPAPTPTPVN